MPMPRTIARAFLNRCHQHTMVRLVAGAIVLLAAAPLAEINAALPGPDMHLTFESHFDRAHVSFGDSDDWMTKGAYGARTLANNKEAEYYSDASVGANPFTVSGGMLTITASRGKNPEGLPFNSGMLTTFRSFHQLYGYFELRARLPAGAGLWPAFWLLPEDGAWPPEIDVMEQLGNNPRTIFVGTHSIVGGPNVATTTAVGVADTSKGFHVFAVDWEANEITWYFDDKPVLRQHTPADLHSPMYLIVNLAVGGRGSWPGPPTRATVFPARLLVDYIRVYGR